MWIHFYVLLKSPFWMTLYIKKFAINVEINKSVQQRSKRQMKAHDGTKRQCLYIYSKIKTIFIIIKTLSFQGGFILKLAIFSFQWCESRHVCTRVLAAKFLSPFVVKLKMLFKTTFLFMSSQFLFSVLRIIIRKGTKKFE